MILNELNSAQISPEKNTKNHDNTHKIIYIVYIIY